MARALELARQAEGRTRPNPMVGCVIVRDDSIVAEGYHRRAGEAHGEVAALQNFDGVDPERCTLYVNLEPCSHWGRTPPCADAIIASGIRRVVVGSSVVDPDPRVSGRGLQRLRDAGIEVIQGVLGEACRRLNAPYFKYIETGLPWVSVKYAMSLDGKIATRTGDSAWISGEASREHVHRLRDRHDAILVGTNTLVGDDPRLTCRIDGGRDPIRVALDASLRAPLSSVLYDPTSCDAPTVVFAATDADAERAEALGERGVDLVLLERDPAGRLPLVEVLAELGRREVLSVLVEGGGEVIASLLDAGQVDRVYAFVAPKLLGGREAPGPVGGIGVASMGQAWQLTDVEIERFGDDVLIEGAPARSADAADAQEREG